MILHFRMGVNCPLSIDQTSGVDSTFPVTKFFIDAFDSFKIKLSFLLQNQVFIRSLLISNSSKFEFYYQTIDTINLSLENEKMGQNYTGIFFFIRWHIFVFSK